MDRFTLQFGADYPYVIHHPTRTRERLSREAEEARGGSCTPSSPYRHGRSEHLSVSDPPCNADSEVSAAPLSFGLIAMFLVPPKNDTH